MDIKNLLSLSPAQKLVNAQQQTMHPDDIYEMAVDAGEKSMPELITCIERGKKHAINKDFYVQLLMFDNPIKMFRNEIKNRWNWFYACPMPTWDQSVFKYFHKDDSIELVWNIAPKTTCEMFLQNLNDVPEHMHQRRDWIVKYYDGTLDKLCKELNNEKDNQPTPVVLFE